MIRTPAGAPSAPSVPDSRSDALVESWPAVAPMKRLPVSASAFEAFLRDSAPGHLTASSLAPYVGAH